MTKAKSKTPANTEKKVNPVQDLEKVALKSKPKIKAVDLEKMKENIDDLNTVLENLAQHRDYRSEDAQRYIKKAIQALS